MLKARKTTWKWFKLYLAEVLYFFQKPHYLNWVGRREPTPVHLQKATGSLLRPQNTGFKIKWASSRVREGGKGGKAVLQQSLGWKEQYRNCCRPQTRQSGVLTALQKEYFGLGTNKGRATLDSPLNTAAINGP